MKMDLNYLKKLIKMLDASNLAELEIEEEGTKIRLSKPRPKIAANVSSIPSIPVPVPAVTSTTVPESVKEETKPEPPKENLIEIKSPMVGTFYKAPSPDAEPYVKTGDTIKPGTVVCIIEAMKLMNEIESEISGKVVKILAENGQAVEYDQPLFLIEKE